METMEDLPADQLVLFKLLQKANQQQTEEIKGDINEKIGSLASNLEKTKQKIQELASNQKILERKLRKNNVIIFGIPERDQGDLLRQTLQKLNFVLETDIREADVNNIYRIGKSNNRPIILEFISFLKKSTIFKDTEKLKKLKESGLSISNDLCKEDREEQKVLRKHLKIARTQNHDTKIKGYKLYINGQLYTVKDLREIENQKVLKTNSEESASEEESEEETEKESTTPTNTKKQVHSQQSSKTSVTEQPLVVKPSAKQKGTKNYYQYSPKNARGKKPIEDKK